MTACANSLTACAISGFVALTCFGFWSGPSSEFPDPPPDPASAIRFPFLWVLPCGCIAPQRGRTNMCTRGVHKRRKEGQKCIAESHHSPHSACTEVFWRMSLEAEWSVYKLRGWFTPAIFCCYLQQLVTPTLPFN